MCEFQFVALDEISYAWYETVAWCLSSCSLQGHENNNSRCDTKIAQFGDELNAGSKETGDLKNEQETFSQDLSFVKNLLLRQQLIKYEKRTLYKKKTGVRFMETASKR